LKVVGDRIYLKLIFFGTALAGKTTALEWLFYHAIPDEMKLVKELRQVKTSFGQTLLFDFAPIEISQNIIARIFSATGQDYYKGTRTKVPADSDGIFIVVDSHKDQLENNRLILQELDKCRREMDGLSEADIVVMYSGITYGEVVVDSGLVKTLHSERDACSTRPGLSGGHP